MSEYNQKKIDEFSGKMLEIINNSHLGLMTSIGHRTGLFETISQLPPSTSDHIAQSSSLNKRYVREWLNAMVVGKIIDYDSQNKFYSLPREHAKVITNEAGLGNLAYFSQLIQPLAAVVDKIVDSFKNGGGVSYDHPQARKYLKIWAQWTSRFFDENLILKTLPLMPDVISALEKGINVLDVGCGNGHSTNLIASNFPNSIVTGYDFSEIAIQAAVDESKNLGLTNVNFEIKNIEKLNEPAKYHFITAFDSIHDQAKPAVVLKLIANSLTDDGTFLMVDIKSSSNVEDNMDHPAAPWLYSSSTMHCMTVSLAYNGQGLGNMWGEEKALEMLNDAGFTNIEVKEVEGDVFNNYYIAKKN
ncbi:MAG: class I SAM-dependent methyltransferase [Candidatus Kariarchaeaceae archaeon]|jgi:2-polyprenyl-3-methyl-5-hydroxy-6-metoxy-1,4-benzoquinol methylase